MRKTTAVILLVVLCAVAAHAQNIRELLLHYADRLEVVPGPEGQTWYAVGSVVFQAKDGMIYCDSAIWIKGSKVRLKGKVTIDDTDFRLVADSVNYNLRSDQWEARGSYVEIWSRKDSLFAVGKQAFHDKKTGFLYMSDRPTLYLRYPDTTNMIEVIADNVTYYTDIPRAEASGDVHITSRDMSSTSGCAVMYPRRDVLDLFENPVVRRKRSDLSGTLISIYSRDSKISRIDVVDSAEGEFTEPTDSTETAYDRSRLKGKRILFDFADGEPDRITCYGQAYSWYYPSDLGKTEAEENEVSGDTIFFAIENEHLHSVTVIGGVIGNYVSRTYSPARLSDTTEVDTGTVALRNVVDTVSDTVSYSAARIIYNLDDSLITLDEAAHATSDQVELDAQRILINTQTDVLRAYSAAIMADSFKTRPTFVAELQPNPIPVVLKDHNDVLLGDYLEYSLDTEKGRIVQSKSKYETGFFYGKKAFREHKDIFYVDDGRYTTCDADEPHYHFHSKHLKFIEGEKLIARPVVFSVGRLPIFIIPYYVFPLKKGRHSGWLPFTFGNIERGDRYIQNVGYYWAASDYWDWQGALDYFELSNRLNFYSRINYNKRYSYNGYISGNYARETSFDRSSGTENRSTRWSVRGAHRHTFSPTFQVDANGSFQSDAKYYNDFSTDLNDRLNRNVRSQINFRKQFTQRVVLSGNITHDENLDLESRTDQLPSLGLTLPSFRPFGSGRRNPEGVIESKWYNNLVATYRPKMLNYSQRITVDSVFDAGQDTTLLIDTTIVVDSLTALPDTTIDTVPQVTQLSDTVSFRSRKKYTRINHGVSLAFPLKLAGYITFNPSFSYREEWFRIYQTDQSLKAGIPAGNYRSYIYSTGVSMSTKVYGTIYPRAFGLIGLRQVITPTVSYRFTPEINSHPEVRTYAGGSAGSGARSQSMSFSLNHIYQAKVKKGESERNLTLVSITSTFSYDFEKDTRRFSNLSTSFNSTVLPRVNFYGSMVHSLYKPGTDELDFWSPYLESFNFNASLTLAGQNFLFDDINRAAFEAGDSTLGGLRGSATPPSSRAGRGWSFSANYSYRESGRGAAFTKASFLRFSLRFNLTPNTTVTYSQYYNISEAKTVNNQVNIVRSLHCWTGTLFWVPVGSNRGWGFRLFVTALPQIKIDQSQNQLSSGYFQSLR